MTLIEKFFIIFSVKIPLAIIFGSLIIGVFIFLSQNPNLLSQSFNKSQISPKPTSQQNIPTEFEPEISPSITPAPTVSDEELIKEVLIAKTGISKDGIEISMSYNDGKIARGSVKNKNEMSGAAWFAGKQNGIWVIAYAGQGVPECSEIAGFDFPTTWLSHCVDSNGTTIQR
ncbi:MAG: hypothetical protein US40_C0007G0017 [Candidatus Roizmanbacteria bacterium GW2011_GWC2_37_13]|uniref:Uncharacterized protein n=1 Tax=Candidatus Roizmanbacteria bacterium GW2011_GWC2_37_13 TaxID=1618486 RepID=A0A0G0G2V7_9BACT|nr:MAG: hypothetical protein US38_C0012G0020 [Candidatus Roizmanbacteria bacterium GW2011_GWC1_37_12]KKQ25518.1 MAG: hypothetical protein US40_C0007G0017 [Candidatus Roizmanbacteria bacterium GW2011_GWC2_37_13]